MYGSVYASVPLWKEGEWLICKNWRGLQPSADYNRGDYVGESLTFASESGIEVETPKGEKFFLKHGNYRTES